MTPPYYWHARKVEIIEMLFDKDMDDVEFEVEVESA